MMSLQERLSRWLIPLVLLSSSLLMLVIGAPRLLAELMLVPGNVIYYEIPTQRHVDDHDLAVLEESRLGALEISALPNAYTDLGLAYLVRAQQAGTEEERLAFARQSAEVTLKGLRLEPRNSFAWLRLSSAYLLLGPGSYDKALEAWRTSIGLARYEPFMFLTRLQVGILLFDAMTPEDDDLLTEQFHMAFAHNKALLRQYSKRNGLLEWMVFLANGDTEITDYLNQ